MSLRRAVLLSLLAHALVVGVGGMAMESLLDERLPAEEARRERSLQLDLVDPAVPALAQVDAPPVGATDRPPASATRMGGPSGATTAAAGATSRDDSTTTEDVRLGQGEDDAPLEASDAEGALPAASTAAPARSAPAVPGRMSPRELADRLGLDTEGLEDDVLRGMFSAMHKYALQSPRPAASTYRQLLRAWVDGLMGYPYPVLEDLARNKDRRFIGGIRIEVDAAGRFRLTDLWIYPDVADPEGRLAMYYERVIRSAAEHVFLPPADAGHRRLTGSSTASSTRRSPARKVLGNPARRARAPDPGRPCQSRARRIGRVRQVAPPSAFSDSSRPR